MSRSSFALHTLPNSSIAFVIFAPRTPSWPVACLMVLLASPGRVEASFGRFSFHSSSISFMDAMTFSSSARILACRAGICSYIVADLFPRICLNAAHSPSMTSIHSQLSGHLNLCCYRSFWPALHLSSWFSYWLTTLFIS